MACYLVVISGSDRGKERLIPEGGRCTVGRNEGVDLQLGDSEVSRRHFTVVDVDGVWRLTDLESSAGTFVNGERVQSCTLIPDDRIRVGSTDLSFATDESRSDDASCADLALSPDLQDLERLVGRTFQGYDIERIQATGNRSVVFRARYRKNGRLTALKILKAGFAQSEYDVQRFVRGINAAKEARSDHLVRVHAAGRKGRNCWVALEFVAGETLAEFIPRQGTDGCLAPDEAIRLGIDLAQALAAIREHKFLHRNVTPDNILHAAEEGLFKLNGLMWAKGLEGKWSEDVTVAGEVLGDIRYYAPEQLGSAGAVDGRIDLYALGATLYTVLTGHAPFQVETLPLLAQVTAICKQVPERPGAVRPDIPVALDAAVMKLLAKHPDERYQTPAELLADLQRMAGIAPTTDPQDARSSERVNSDVAPGMSETPRAAIVPEATVAPEKGRKPARFFWLAPGAALLLIALVLIVASRAGRRPNLRAVDAEEQVTSDFAVDTRNGVSRTKVERKTRDPVVAQEENADADATVASEDWFDRTDEPMNRYPSATAVRTVGEAANAKSAGDRSVTGEMSRQSATQPDTANQPDTMRPEERRQPTESKSIASLSTPATVPGRAGKVDFRKTEQFTPITASAAGIVSFINQEIRRGWTDGNVQPSPLADDAEWLRRVHLDLTGKIPRLDVVEEFLADKAASKRARMVELLFDSPEYVNYWSTVWTNLSVGRRPGGRASRAGMQRYFREAFHENRAWNEIVVELVSAEGHFEQNGAVNFVLAEIPGAANNAVEITDKTTRLLMGVQVQCTQCHNHPFNDWQQRQFWEFNTFFRGAARIDRTRLNVETGQNVFDYTELINNPVNGPVYFERRSGLMEVAYPKFFGQEIENLSDSNRRSELARRMVAGERPLIAQALVNRMWGHLFGYGFTRPIDDMGPHNAPSHPELLNRLAEEFVRSGYDVKQMLRWCVSCDAYQLTSRTADDATDNPAQGTLPLFSHYYLKALSPESLCESLLVATSAGNVGITDWEEAARNRQRLIDQFLDEFIAGGEESPTSYSGSIPQSLTLMNGELIRKGIATETGRLIPTVLARHKTDPERIRTLYLICLGREPDRAETALVMQHLRRRKDFVVVYQNVCWALLNSNEFAINH